MLVLKILGLTILVLGFAALLLAGALHGTPALRPGDPHQTDPHHQDLLLRFLRPRKTRKVPRPWRFTRLHKPRKQHSTAS